MNSEAVPEHIRTASPSPLEGHGPMVYEITTEQREDVRTTAVYMSAALASGSGPEIREAAKCCLRFLKRLDAELLADEAKQDADMSALEAVWCDPISGTPVPRRVLA